MRSHPASPDDRRILILLKSIFIVWSCLQLVLPGCLCQLLEPLGIEVPGHHHHRGAASLRLTGAETGGLFLLPGRGGDTSLPCHCDERPDRNTDESIGSATSLTPGECASPWDARDGDARRRLRLARISGHASWGRALGNGLPSSEEMRIARCVHLL